MTLEFFQCDICPKSYDTKSQLNRHMKRHSKPLKCKACPSRFPFDSELQRHIISQHRVGNDQHPCPVNRCRSKFKRKDNLKKHIRKFHAGALPSPGSDDPMVDATIIASLPQNVALSTAVESFNGIGSVTMFMQAASFGDITTLELLMNSGFTTETRADDRSTALHCAARNGQSRTVRYLLEKGARMDASNERYRLPLHEAFLSSDTDTVEVLMEQLTGEELRYGSWAYYHCLAQTKNIKIFELSAQHLKNKLVDFSTNKVFAFAMMAKNDTLAAALLDHPDFDVNEYNWGCAPIHDAARYGNAKTMELLLASDRVDKSRTTRHDMRDALHVAASNGHANIVEQLLNLNFDVNSLDAYQRTPLQHAAIRGHLKIITLLVDKWKADISSSDRYGHTPLLHAAFKGHWKCVNMLLEYIDSKSHHDSVDIQTGNMEFVKKDIINRVLNSAAFENRNICYRSSNNLLHCAVQNRDSEALEVLLSHDGIDVNKENYDRRSPLIMAALKGQTEAVRLLLQHPQIDVNQKNLRGITALSWAKRFRHQEIVDLLLSHGAVDDQAENAQTITTEDGSSLTTIKAGHMPNTPLQPEHEIDPGFDFDTFMEGVPALDDISDTEDEMMGREFS